MKIKLNVMLLLICILFCSDVFALDWVKLHESANNLNVQDVHRMKLDNIKTIDSLYVLGLFYLSAYNDDEAQTIFQEIIDRSPNTKEAKWGMGEVARRKYKLEQATEIFKDLILENPSFSPSYISLAYVKFNLKDYKQAIILAKHVIDQGQGNVDKSNYVRAYLILAGAKGMLAQNGGLLAKITNGIMVLPTIKKAQNLQPEFPGVYFGLGTFYLMAPGFAGGDIEKAFIYLEKAIQLDPHLIDAYVRLAQAYKQKGDIVSFKQYIDLALEKDPRNLLANEIRSENSEIMDKD